MLACLAVVWINGFERRKEDMTDIYRVARSFPY
jgi:hypothetical protein